MTAISSRHHEALSASERQIVLEVYLDGHPGVAGRLVHTGLETTFAYDAAYIRDRRRAPLSLSLPVSDRVFGPREVLPFFENLLPEGKRLNAIALQLGLDERDLIGILEHVGRDCPGAVSIVREGEAPAKTPGEFPGDYEEVAKGDLLRLLEKGIAPRREPGGGPGTGLEFSLAGVQGKAAVLMDAEGRFHLARGGAPSTHIVKMPDVNFSGMVLNEAFCLELARAMGLVAIEPRIVELAPGREVLVVPRYDREVENFVAAREGSGLAAPSAGGIGGPATIRRIHQEDFCQALGFTSDRKYTHRGGPTAEDLLRIDQVDAVGSFRIQLLDGMIFNFLVGNSDAHAKNYALLHGRDFRTVLAPLYDVLSIVLYPDYRQGQALSFGAETGDAAPGPTGPGKNGPGKNAPGAFEDLTPAAVRRAAERLGMRPSLITGRIATAARRILPIGRALREANPAKYGPVGLRVMSAIGRQVGLLNDAFGFGIEVEEIEFESRGGGWQTSS